MSDREKISPQEIMSRIRGVYQKEIKPLIGVGAYDIASIKLETLNKGIPAEDRDSIYNHVHFGGEVLAHFILLQRKLDEQTPDNRRITKVQEWLEAYLAQTTLPLG